ncbi:hypothetical protein TRFO_33698 [Tritrichomonas foetus]|uniref:Uncharacterized protein n=1 Tax=Tritrichomonas foetus TaxID=1144522 RepID=A0A1J4JQI7_9EUKA|nr:hypothetical protein TRFO_33698 [Tritrichomonas foetus]|eukprot:OHS99779.1 hypothetical protein TRFO_33698 [Tritrichomonas foetus]
MNKILDTHKEVCANVNIAIEELNEYANIIQPHIDALYALHHYPVPEEHPEEEEQPSEQPNNEEEEKEGEEKGENDGETETETETTNDETEKPSEIAQEEEPEISPEDGENEEKPPNEEEEEKQEKPVEEEEEPEPDPESLEVQAKIQETLKWPTLEKCAEICEKMKDAEIGLQEFVDQIKAKAEDCNVQIKEEKFRWKKLEVSMLELKEQLTVAVNMLKISVLSAEELQMKAVQTEIDNYDNFVIPNVEKEILDAAAIKFAATFQFA